MIGGKPLCIDGYCGLGGWSEGFLANGWECIGFDIERHDYGTGGYPGQLVLQDMRTIHGSQFKDADCLVFSPPCQNYSYMAMPWKRGKAIAAAIREDQSGRKLDALNALFNACFRIQAEASETAGHHIPMVVENVKGAQPWVGRAKANFGSFYLWGDIAMVGNRIVIPQAQFAAESVRAWRQRKPDGLPALNSHDDPKRGRKSLSWCEDMRKVPGMNFHDHENTGGPGRSFQSAAVVQQKQPVWFNDDKRRADKGGGDWFGAGKDCSLMRRLSSKSSARKAASAQIAKIPAELSEWVARAYWPYYPMAMEAAG